ncbi:MAG: ATP-dependent DNA helicase RecG [Nocardioidaceae bacterium]
MPPTKPGVTWDSKLAVVAGKQAAKIEKAFGYRTVGDLLQHYPRRYVDKGKVGGVEGFVLDEFVTVIARVISAEQFPYADRRRGGMAYRLQVVVGTDDAELALTFFDKRQHTADWRLGLFEPGRFGLFSGKVGRFRDAWQLTNPQTKIFADAATHSAEDQAVAVFEDLPELISIYPATAAISSWQLEDAIALALELIDAIPDVVPPALAAEEKLVPAERALRWIHRPDSWSEKGAAEKRLRFEEAFVTQTVLALRRAETAAQPARPRVGRDGGLLDRFDQRLPFTLTDGQRRIGVELLHDLAQPHPMHRLLQGEVGSGKTVVALRAMLRVVDSGGQAALLAPTEVLAQQHARSISALLGELAQGGMLGGADDGTRVALLTGSLGAAARREALLETASGAAGIVIGTHALLEEKVAFADLGLVVVDEQHRFGVEQRAVLSTRSDEPPHVLVMTATPIPRTVAMTVFGDLETSTLRELPAGRLSTQTNVVPLADRPGWLDRVWARVREEVEGGHQVYVVCPRIGGAETRTTDEEAEEDERVPLAAVEEVGPELTQGVLAGLRVELLHGRLSPDRKEAVMRAFAAGEVDVLVSTTVLEVGVDVPNATAMVVLDADRFGVSQLHQLRGRVGRGGSAGLCLLVTRAEAGTPARERLAAVASTVDGFALSQLDLEQRREGDVLGQAQAGRRSSLRLLSVLRDEDVIIRARAVATELVTGDPGLAAAPALAAAVRRLEQTELADYLEKA